MVAWMACGKLNSSSLVRHSTSFASISRIVALSNASDSVGAESDAPEQQQQQQQRGIAADHTPFVKPLSTLYSVVPCRFCRGSEEVKCDVCEGQGRLAPRGFHKRNPVAMARVVGSNWTTREKTFGRHHFHVHSKRQGPGKDWFLEMVSTCDETTRFWINAQILKDRERWSAGWLQRGELQGVEGAGQVLQDSKAATVCKACKGRGTRPCPLCLTSEESRELDIIDV